MIRRGLSSGGPSVWLPQMSSVPENVFPGTVRIGVLDTICIASWRF